MSRVLSILVFLASFSVPVLSQGYVVEIRGTWKTSGGTSIGNRQRLGAGTRVDNVSSQQGDAIFVLDQDGNVVPCSNGCKTLMVPSQPWTRYFWCKIFSCGSRKYTTFGAKGSDCQTRDGLAIIDRSGITNLSLFLNQFADKSSGELELRFQRTNGDKIVESERKVTEAAPTVGGLEPGFYDVIDGSVNSRLLVLPAEVYEKEKARYTLFREKMTHWKQQRLSDCTVRTFVVSYLDHVFKENQTEIKKYKTEGASRH